MRPPAVAEWLRGDAPLAGDHPAPDVSMSTNRRTAPRSCTRCSPFIVLGTLTVNEVVRYGPSDRRALPSDPGDAGVHDEHVALVGKAGVDGATLYPSAGSRDAVGRRLLRGSLDAGHSSARSATPSGGIVLPVANTVDTSLNQ